MQTRTKFWAILLGLNFLVACGGPGGNGGGGSTPPPTATLTADPTTITAGDNAQLIFTSTNANAGVIDNGVGPVGVNSQVTVNPTTTTTYMYSVTGPGGGTSATATVTVNAAPPPPTVSLTVSPGSIFAGQKPVLTWQSTNATSVVIDNNIGNVQPASGGSVTLTGTLAPTQTTTYTATATGNGVQATATATVTVSTVTSFDGILPDKTIAGEQDIDPNGAIGTKQFLEYVNTEYQAFDKNPPYAAVTINGSTTGSAPQAIGWPWQIALNGSLGNEDCLGTGIKLDAQIIFDRLASRWVIAAKAVRASGGLDYYFCIAVSNGDDVTASGFGWYAYEYSLDTVLKKDSTNAYYFPDWPKIGAWPDAYYVTMDMEDLSLGGTEVGVAVCAFDRVSMLSGTMRTPQCFTDADSSRITHGDYLAHSLIPADVDGSTAPPTGQDEFLVSIQNPPYDGTTTVTTSNTINVWAFHVDWSIPANSTFTVASSPTVTTYTPACYLIVPVSPETTTCVNEPAATIDGTTVGQAVDSVGDRLMPRFTYRNFGSYGSYLVSHTIQTGPGTGNNPLQTGVRWYELRSSQSSASAVCDNGTVTLGATPIVCQSGTINPDALLFRFLPSIAQDKDGNAAVGYSVSNHLNNPGINFSYWNLRSLNADTNEVTILDGSNYGEEVNPLGAGQWGSYSGMSLDPADDCTFWYVNEYWPTSAAWATRIANFKVPGCQ